MIHSVVSRRTARASIAILIFGRLTTHSSMNYQRDSARDIQRILPDVHANDPEEKSSQAPSKVQICTSRNGFEANVSSSSIALIAVAATAHVSVFCMYLDIIQSIPCSNKDFALSATVAGSRLVSSMVSKVTFVHQPAVTFIKKSRQANLCSQY
jgi:hypothetical protein